MKATSEMIESAIKANPNKSTKEIAEMLKIKLWQVYSAKKRIKEKEAFIKLNTAAAPTKKAVPIETKACINGKYSTYKGWDVSSYYGL